MMSSKLLFSNYRILCLHCFTKEILKRADRYPFIVAALVGLACQAETTSSMGCGFLRTRSLRRNDGRRPLGLLNRALPFKNILPIVSSLGLLVSIQFGLRQSPFSVV